MESQAHRQVRKAAHPDGYLDDAGIAVEVDSYEFHLSANGWKRTMAHDNALAAAGILVLRFTPKQIREEPGRVRKEIEAAYLERITKAPPDVRVS